ncbi:mechanosensitive ion channel family protein [Variovorax sp. J22R133]|uniref:mechanosensitive ion channel family protein n=1 Tax=Variovorax brevis TaxID=3053503 RepID=UPI00257572A4|nr:mechanosensitive ion channel family protein [Variovorax sp. J22R133]MDM0114171.1 mechanosensitive ion channel family protein [Variovorax sp. J22R133]
MNTEAIWIFLSTQGADFGLKVLGALAAWIIGRWLIGIAQRLVAKAIAAGQRMDPTLSKYLVSILGVVLTILLILSILDMFGVRTTSFAALLAGAGLAIGTAWGGLLTHFAAGVFLQVLRPYRVGDFVTLAGLTGTVKELGLFGTTIITPDNTTTLIGNNKVLSDSIQNFSQLPFRRVETTAKLANGVDVTKAIELLKAELATIPNVSTEQPPDVEILQFTPEGPLLAVRPYTHTDHYWQVYFDTHRAVVKTFGAAGFPTPETPISYRTAGAQAANA